MITCFSQASPFNGQLQGLSQTDYGSVLSVDCNEGYFLVGDETIQCGDPDEDGLGEWNGTLGFCKCKLMKFSEFNNTIQQKMGITYDLVGISRLADIGAALHDHDNDSIS